MFHFYALGKLPGIMCHGLRNNCLLPFPFSFLPQQFRFVLPPALCPSPSALPLVYCHSPGFTGRHRVSPASCWNDALRFPGCWDLPFMAPSADLAASGAAPWPPGKAPWDAGALMSHSVFIKTQKGHEHFCVLRALSQRCCPHIHLTCPFLLHKSNTKIAITVSMDFSA